MNFTLFETKTIYHGARGWGQGISSSRLTLQRLHVQFRKKIDPVVFEKKMLTDEARRTNTNAEM